jgi:4-hydroxybenzoate polyprenyltransferase
LLALAGNLAGLGRWYWLGLAIATASSLHQQYLIRNRDPDDCFRAFLNNNLFGLAVFGGIMLDYLFTA